ncbi:biotin synthase BioB [Anaerosacchariphilus polymeriproducens]|uniref:Biotin synthase n=1 Tax=Anaerosacchariphilus polymeriproducens TaxID=1812858 RepID=A0A371ATL0_9FIRM|nr:biotin synthase BioB [Anaerosacchariphilus polymeriproducens]RDU22820.1 biotin synthase BioB [Anaerosacchariphilus polymeriproducens]
MNVRELKEKVIEGYLITKEEALELTQAPLEEVSKYANEIRMYFCGNNFDICTIVNGKSGRCSEDCKYCAQSASCKAEVKEHPLLDEESLFRQAKYNADKGVLRYSIVTSGKKLSDKEIDLLCESIRGIKKKTSISICASLGLLEKDAYKKLKDAGVSRIHNNLETSKDYFHKICTTHTYEEKIKSIKAALEAGLDVCSGGIMGVGESMEDRIDLALALRELGIKSVPVNMLNPIEGTPFEKMDKLAPEEMQMIVSVFRFLLPDSFIRLAGGRGLIGDKGRKCFQSGSNAAITGDMLTTAGISIESDLATLKDIGYHISKTVTFAS